MPFPVIETPPGRTGLAEFAVAVVARLTWQNVVGALVLGTLVGQIYFLPAMLVHQVSDVPPRLWISRRVIEFSSGLSLLATMLVADEAVARGAHRVSAYVGAVVLGACLAGASQWAIRALLHLRVMSDDAGPLVRIMQPFGVAFHMALYGGLVAFLYVNLRTARAAAARRREAEIARGTSKRRTLESTLQAMQARVEPQFLFNTLAQVKQLFDHDPERGGSMLDELIAYLRAALPHLRESSSTLGKEAELARAYLSIVRIRLGDRLAFDITVPDELKDAALPPMMLLPLVDHALVYGLEPGRDGGTIRIETDVGPDRLRLSITDNGAGFLPDRRSDDLDDIRARLHALFDDGASLRLERLQALDATAGTRATLEIPYESPLRGHR